jgi:FkbM family methyltransferase
VSYKGASSELDCALSETAKEVSLAELRDRLVHIEHKVNNLIHRDVPISIQKPEQIGLVKNQLFGSITYAQHGDDLILANIFHLLNTKSPTYLDIGAHHPFAVSNTALLYTRGSRGVNIEANPLLIDAFRKQRPDDITLHAGVCGKPGPATQKYFMFGEDLGLNTFDPKMAVKTARSLKREPKIMDLPMIPIGRVIVDHCAGLFPDLLSIDVEGMELEILSAIDYRANAPKIICAQGNDDAARAALKALLEPAGYTVHFRAADNLFFVKSELRKQLL